MEEKSTEKNLSEVPQETEELTSKDSLDSLQEELQEAQKTAHNYWDQLLRLQADFANFRKRSEKEKMDAIRLGKILMLEKMISLLDIMEEALKHTHGSVDNATLKQGFEMVIQEFSSLLKSEGAQPLKTVGEQFDPHLHEAVEQIETEEEDKNNIVLSEIQKGYTLNNQLLRPAKVKVAKVKTKENKEEKQES